MFVGCLEITLALPENHTQRGKRAVVRRLVDRVRTQFNVAVAETATQDDWSIATVGVVCVSNEARHSHAVLMNVLNFVEELRVDAEIRDVQTEIVQAL